MPIVERFIFKDNASQTENKSAPRGWDGTVMDGYRCVVVSVAVDAAF
jgi:hypothetical protein